MSLVLTTTKLYFVYLINGKSKLVNIDKNNDFFDIAAVLSVYSYDSENSQNLANILIYIYMYNNVKLE